MSKRITTSGVKSQDLLPIMDGFKCVLLIKDGGEVNIEKYMRCVLIIDGFKCVNKGW
jgi:hypothetical protein